MKATIAFLAACASAVGAAPTPTFTSTAHIELPDMRLTPVAPGLKPFTVRSLAPRFVKPPMPVPPFGGLRSDQTDLFLSPREQEKVIRDLQRLMATPTMKNGITPITSAPPRLTPVSGAAH